MRETASERTYKIWLKQHVFQWGTHVRRGTAAVCTYVAVMAVMLCAAVTKASRWPWTRRAVKVKASDSSSEGLFHCQGSVTLSWKVLNSCYSAGSSFLSHCVRTVEALCLIRWLKAVEHGSSSQWDCEQRFPLWSPWWNLLALERLHSLIFI